MPHFQTNRGDGPHILDALPTAVSSEDENAGIPGGLTDAARAAEEARIAAAPVVGPVTGMPLAHNDGGPYEHRPTQAAKGEVDPAGLHPFEPPRHDAYAAENSGYVAERVIPGGPTNAHPDFAVAGPAGLTTTATVSTAGNLEVKTVDSAETTPVGGEPVMPPAAPLADTQVTADGTEAPVPTQSVDAEAVVTAGEPNPPGPEPANEVAAPEPGIESTNPAGIPGEPTQES